MKRQVMVLVLGGATAVAQGGTIVHMDRTDFGGKTRPEAVIYAQDGQFRLDTLDADGHVSDFVLVRDGSIWQVDVRKRTFFEIDQTALAAQRSQMQDRMQAALQNLPPERRAAMEERMKALMAGRSQSTVAMTDTGKSDHVGSWACEVWQVRRGGAVSSDACIAPRGSLTGGDELVDAVHKAAAATSGVVSALPGARATEQQMAVYGKADGFPVRTRELARDGSVESAETVSRIERQSLPADRFAIPQGFTQTTLGGRHE
ncbi:MAG: DUF4412 domain-containing protein [Steroidobacteraceae bacterium]